MLAPHHRKDSELGKIWFATENFLDPLEFFRGETVFRHQLRSNDRIGGRFGAGHRPRTLTEAERDSTRLRTQLTDSEVCCGGSSSPLLDVKIMSAKPSSFIALASPAERPTHLVASSHGGEISSTHRLPRRSLGEGGFE